MDASVRIRPVAMTDVVELAALYRDQRDFLAPYEPIRPDSFFTEEGQRRETAQAVSEWRAGRLFRFAIRTDDRIVGVITVSGVSRGAFASARIGYFVANEWNGRGIASAAVGQVAEWAFGEARLHRLSAGTLLSNAASQRVLSRNGFRLVGISRRYLAIAGRWQDHVLFARTVEDPPADLGPVDEKVRRLDRLLG